MKHKIWAIGFIFLLLFFAFFVLLSTQMSIFGNKQNMKANYTITLTKKGFVPNEITIKKDQVVKFITNRNKFFWPASNTHPTHEIYPQFDPKEPIDPKGDWEFRFDRVGIWRYHDHLAPYYTGTIIVKN